MIFAALLLLAGGIVGLAILPRVWANEWNTQNPDLVPDYWGLGPAMWRAFIRIAPLSFVFCLLFGTAMTLLNLDIDAAWSEVIRRWCLYGLGPVVVLMLGVGLLNEPKRVVAPHLRHQPGALDEWRGATVGPTEPPVLRSGKKPKYWP